MQSALAFLERNKVKASCVMALLAGIVFSVLRHRLRKAPAGLAECFVPAAASVPIAPVAPDRPIVPRRLAPPAKDPDSELLPNSPCNNVVFACESGGSTKAFLASATEADAAAAS